MILFKELAFEITPENRIVLQKYFFVDHAEDTCDPVAFSFPEVDVAGGNCSGRPEQFRSELTARLRYVSHKIDGNQLTIVQKNDLLEITSVFTGFDDTNAIRVLHTAKNISGENLRLTLLNTLSLVMGEDVVKDHKDWYFHRFTNARYTESMPDVRSFYDMGMYWNNGHFHIANLGNVSCLEGVPQGILENRKNSDFLMFQIESYHQWFFSLGSCFKRFNVQIGGPNARHQDWNKALAPGQSYTCIPAAFCAGKSLNAVLGQMTRYRRHLKPMSIADEKLPSVYNEYMHYSWDNPFAATTQATAPTVAKTGCKYYIIDAGWHSSAKYDTTASMYRNFGSWIENRERFPEGIRATADYVRSLGMKFGLWIAPEVVGCDNKEMLDYYDDGCFITRNGKRVFHGSGYLLDYRHPKVIDYMTKTIDRMVKEYGCDYIKFDGCPNPGMGTDVGATGLGDGLEKSMDAFTDWAYQMTQRHPQVLFEDCAGGGLRTDYKALSIFHLISTSDQTSYIHYPYICGNILCSVLPEQAAVWSYPVDTKCYVAEDLTATDVNVSKERVVMNMINSLLGRVHLASRLHYLSEEKLALVAEGIALYDKIAQEKKNSLPYLPKGYSMFGDTLVAAGIRTENKVYLAVWNLGGERHVELPLPEISVKAAKVVYPVSLPTEFSFTENSLTVDFTEDYQARFFELTS